MADEIKTWERMQDEPNRWFQWFERFRLLGPDRSLLAVFNQWRHAKSRGVARNSPKSWRDAAERFRWRERAEAWDKYVSDQAAAAGEAERLRILSSGFSQRHARVQALNELADLLLEELKTEDKRWLPDVKSIGTGFSAERVDIVRFNSAIIEQFRDTLDDLAAEMGERAKNVDVTSGGQPLKIIVEYADKDDKTDAS